MKMQDYNYITLQRLIKSFNYGLFFNLSTSRKLLPNGIAALLDVDDKGYCWFLFHFPRAEAYAFENDFPARFRLYEKGRDCYVEICGKAELCLSPGEWARCSKISSGMAKALRYYGLILCFKFDTAIVNELSYYSRRNWIQKIFDSIDEWVTGKSITETVYQSEILST